MIEWVVRDLGAFGDAEKTTSLAWSAVGYPPYQGISKLDLTSYKTASLFVHFG